MIGASFREKYQAFQMEIEQVRDLVSKSVFLVVEEGQKAGEIITQRLRDVQNAKE